MLRLKDCSLSPYREYFEEFTNQKYCIKSIEGTRYKQQQINLGICFSARE